eukprot:SAG11_NODE_22518_length_404_cov_1.718033_1_plen_87_part_10
MAAAADIASHRRQLIVFDAAAAAAAAALLHAHSAELRSNGASKLQLRTPPAWPTSSNLWCAIFINVRFCSVGRSISDASQPPVNELA